MSVYNIIGISFINPIERYYFSLILHYMVMMTRRSCKDIYFVSKGSNRLVCMQYFSHYNNFYISMHRELSKMFISVPLGSRFQIYAAKKLRIPTHTHLRIFVWLVTNLFHCDDQYFLANWSNCVIT